MAKAWDIEGLQPNQPLWEKASLIILSKFREAFHFQEAVINSNDIEAVHDMRVSLRRLWAAMTGFRSSFNEDEEFIRLSRSTRKLARKLGEVRDLDVLIEILQKRLQKEGSTNATIIAISNTINSCAKKRIISRNRLLKYFHKLDEELFCHQFIDFFTHRSSLTQHLSSSNLFIEALENFYTHQLDNNFQQAEALHQLRIAAKKLRYSLEFFEICYQHQVSSYLKSLRMLQELLGDIHDCDVLIELLERRKKRMANKELFLVGLEQLIGELQTERGIFVEEFTKLWQEKFQRYFHARLKKLLQNSTLQSP